jgi:hypothetical protein
MPQIPKEIGKNMLAVMTGFQEGLLNIPEGKINLGRPWK